MILSNPQEPYQPAEQGPGGGRRRQQPPPVPPRAAPQQGTPQPGVPQPEVPGQPPLPPHEPSGQQPPAPHFGTPHYGTPDYGQPQHGQPQYGPPPSTDPLAGHPQYGTAQYGTPQGGHPQYQGSPYGAPAVPGPYGAPGQQPPARNRRKLWIILGIVGGVVLLAVVGVALLVNLVGGATAKAKGLADDFTQLVIAGDTDAAYDDFLDPALQDKLSKEEFAAGVQSLELDGTCKPSYNDLKVSTENGNNAADVAGVISCDGKEVDLAYRFDGNKDMKMINIKLRPKA